MAFYIFHIYSYLSITTPNLNFTIHSNNGGILYELRILIDPSSNKTAKVENKV
jgi:hypothetical protein